MESVTVKYPDSVPLDNVSLNFPQGSTAVMGPSGTGKSTLLRLIAGVQTPTSGVVQIDGAPVKPATWRSAGDPRVCLIHQDYRLVTFLTVEQNLLLAAELRGLRAAQEKVDHVLEMVGLPQGMRTRIPTTMSGGEQQRVAIARALMTGAQVILADEPTGALDQDNTLRISKILADIGRADGLAVVVATHDLGVSQLMDRCLRLSAGAALPAA